MILGASLTRCSLPACACFTDGCVPLGGGFSRCSRWSSPGWRMHLPWRSGRLEGTDLAYLTRRPLTRVRVVVCSSLAPGSRITWLGSIDLQCTVLVLDVVTLVQTSTRAGLGFRAGVKDYRLTYFMDDYKVIDTDLLAAFRVVPQPGVPSRYSSSLSCWTNQGRWLCWEHLRYKGR